MLGKALPHKSTSQRPKESHRMSVPAPAPKPVPQDPELDRLNLDHPKVRQILDGARSAFRELGYEGASVDDIARRAGVSKPTLYNHFPTKQAVFSAFLRVECHENAERMFSLAPPTGSFAVKLRALARGYVSFLLSDFAQTLFRVAVGESSRFPELGRVFYNSGPALGVSRMEALLKGAHESGELHVPDARTAAYQFAEICKADLFYKRLLQVIDEPSPAEIKRVANKAADAFLRSYAPKEGRSGES